MRLYTSGGLRKESPPRVLHIVNSLDFGGLESRMVLLAENTGVSKFHHVFCSLTGGGHAATRLSEIGAEVRLLGGGQNLPMIRVAFRLVSLIREIRPQIVHSHGAEANLLGILTASVLQVPVRVSEEIGIPQHSLVGRIVFRIIHRLATHVVAVSDATRQALIQNREVEPSRCQVLESPGRLHSRRIPLKRDRDTTLAYVGRLEPIKNPLALLEAIVLLHAEGFNLRLLVVGDGSLYPQMLERVQELALTDRVILTGFQAHPFDFVAGADLFVQPSISEGMSMALVEAMSSGIPCLVSPVGGANEIVEEGVTGWFFGSLDARAIASRLADVLSKPRSKRDQIGKSGSDLVALRFSPEAYVAQLDHLYGASLATPRAR